MTEPYYGATRAEWEAFASLNLPDLLPTVCDPTVRRHPSSNNATPLDKLPSGIDRHGFGFGMLNWPNLVTTSIEDWVVNDKLGICMIMRTLHAIDIDIEDIGLATHTEGFIREHLGIDGMLLPLRMRAGTGKRAMLFRLSDGPDTIRKQVVRSPGNGMVEFLFHKQQLRVAGRHRDGQRLEWPEGIPRSLTDIPAIKMSELQDLIRALAHELPDGEATALQLDGTTGARAGERRASQVASDDPVVAFLETTDLIRAFRPDGALDVHCPWASEHEHPTPDNVTEATFFPIGLGEIKDQPGFKCMHATCAHRNWQMFLSVIGFEDTAFDIVPPQSAVAQERTNTRPLFTYKGRSNKIEPTLPNVTAALRWPAGFGYTLRYDTFKDAIVYHNAVDTTWRLLDDDTYTTFRLRLSQIGMDGTVPKEYVRDAVSLVAREASVDTAQEWLKAQEWDGIPRLEQFHVRALGAEDTPYHQAVLLYMWTALVGRIMHPGCKADMLPIFIGDQGLRKSSLAECIVPSPDEYTAITLDNRDDNLARQLRGKLIAEWAELRGLNSRAGEAIKGWISLRSDEWIPKFKEHRTNNPRRFLIIGTANEKQVLNDPTGARRMLPMRLTRSIDTNYVELNRNQLWAEALMRWRRYGIEWQRAEELAKDMHFLSSVRDLWETGITDWLREQGYRDGWTSMQLLSGGCSLPPTHANQAAYQRLRRIMARIGWEEDDHGRWYCNLV